MRVGLLFATILAFSNAAVITANLNNLQDMQYSITLYIGSMAKQMTFIVDTGSSWLWVPSTACTSCSNSANAFNPALSTTYQNKTIKENITYGIGSISGYESMESTTLNQNGSSNFTTALLLVTKALSLQAMVPDGVMGLTPSFSPNSDSASSTTSGRLFIDSLYQSGLIN